MLLCCHHTLHGSGSDAAWQEQRAAGVAKSKDTLRRWLLWGSSLHLKQVALSKAHVLKSHKSVDGKG